MSESQKPYDGREHVSIPWSIFGIFVGFGFIALGAYMMIISNCMDDEGTIHRTNCTVTNQTKILKHIFNVYSGQLVAKATILGENTTVALHYPRKNEEFYLGTTRQDVKNWMANLQKQHQFECSYFVNDKRTYPTYTKFYYKGFTNKLHLSYNTSMALSVLGLILILIAGFCTFATIIFTIWWECIGKEEHNRYWDQKIRYEESRNRVLNENQNQNQQPEMNENDRRAANQNQNNDAFGNYMNNVYTVTAMSIV